MSDFYDDSNYERLDNEETGAVIVSAIFFMFWGVTALIGLIRLFVHWDRFGDRAVPMLLVTIFIPFGFLWPLLATPYVYTKYGLMSQQRAIMMSEMGKRGSKAPLYY